MALILDHINGVATDNRLENLQIVCPNCAATLDTHCGRNLPRHDVEVECGRCGKPFVPLRPEQRYCSRTCGTRYPRVPGPRLASRKVERPPYEQLVREIRETSYVAVGRRYGVSDNAIRKWIRAYERELGVAPLPERREPETGAMAEAGLHRTIPALPMREMGAAVAFYRERLGFEVLHHDGGFAVLGRDDAVLHLWEACDEEWRDREDLRARPICSGAESFIAGTASARIELADVDALFAELEAADVLHPTSRGGVAATDFGPRVRDTRSRRQPALVLPLGDRRVGGRAPPRRASRLAIAHRAGRPGGSSCLNGHMAVEFPGKDIEREYIARSMRARLIALTVAALLLPASSAAAGDPIMPLSQVRSGMQCTGYSVVRGTEISSFDVEILEVIDGDASGQGPRLLVRVSGPAVDGTGVGPGFSGSPIYCRDDQGTARNAGAISESLGEYGGDVVLATPIEAILGTPTDAPAARGDAAFTSRASAKKRRRYRALMSRAEPLATPLTVSGVSTAMGRALERAGRRAGRPVLAAPAGPLGSYPPQPMRPGAAVGVSYSMGDIQIGAIGTVAYTDEDRVWAFGHPFESAGERRLFLQDAYVYRVIDNPIAIPDAASTYKFASLGHTLGTISNDERDAVAGRTGALPPTVPIRVFANDLDTGRRQVTGIRAADESRIGLPEGASPLSFVGPLAVTEAAASLLRSAPGRLRPTSACRSRSTGSSARCASATATCRRSPPTRNSSAPRNRRGARLLGRLRRPRRDRRLQGHAARIGEVAGGWTCAAASSARSCAP